jgi:vancomycin permeability regulator SanA
MRHGQGRRLRGPAVIAVTLAAYGLLLPTGWAMASTGRYRANVERVPPMPVAIVFGAGLFGDQPSPFLARRLDLGAELYERGKVGAVLVSGDNSRVDYDETGAMRDYLVRAGVPGRKVVGDHAGFDTWDSCVRARRIFGVDRAIVVTQRFHLARAVALCRAAGIEAWGVGDATFSDHPAPSANSYARELPAMVKAAYDAAVKPDPHFLGRRETGVQEALATK